MRNKKVDGSSEIKKVFSSWKIKYEPIGIHPSEPCHKCGKNYWTESDESLCWSCIQCGNMTYLTLGSFHQQIDTVLRSDRKAEFVHSEDSDKVLPKRNSKVKALAFKAEKL